jgi:hypothetical protein
VYRERWHWAQDHAGLARVGKGKGKLEVNVYQQNEPQTAGNTFVCFRSNRYRMLAE